MSITPFTELCKRPRIDLAQQSPLPAPLNVYVEPINSCNLKCKCCPESRSDFFEQQGGKHALSWADWESIAGKLEEVGQVKTLHFYVLGEPLLNKLTTRFIKDATDRKLAEKTILTTNGTMVGRYAQELSQSGLTYLRVSLYQEYKQHWNKIASGLDVLRWMPHRPWIYVKAFEDDPDLGQFKWVSDEFELVGTMNWNGMAGKLGNDLTGTKQACPMPFYTLVIHSDLRASVCCVDWNKSLVVGDLKTQSIKEVWHGDAMHDIRLKHLAGKRCELDACRDCTIHHLLQDDVDGLSPMEYTRRAYGTPLRGPLQVVA